MDFHRLYRPDVSKGLSVHTVSHSEKKMLLSGASSENNSQDIAILAQLQVYHSYWASPGIVRHGHIVCRQQ